MTSDAAEYQERHRIRIIDDSLRHLRSFQLALHRIFQDAVTLSSWSEFNVHGLRSYTDKNDWNMILSNPQTLGHSILDRQKQDVNDRALVLGDTLLKLTGSRLMDTPPEDLRESPKQLSQVEMTLEEISELLGHKPQEKPNEIVIVLHQGLQDMVNLNTGLSEQAAHSFGYKPALVDVDEKKLDSKRRYLDVAQMWAELAMLETRVMRTSLVIDHALQKKGISQERIIADYHGSLVLSTPTQWQFVASDKQAFMGLGRAKQTLHQALVH